MQYFLSNALFTFGIKRQLDFSENTADTFFPKNTGIPTPVIGVVCIGEEGIDLLPIDIEPFPTTCEPCGYNINDGNQISKIVVPFTITNIEI